ncbi:hypothetical protein VSS74_28000 [Conexibacter stalactiti]|uniref:Uncharacterized protein n=1 Tax=Conexibacter stalactiti TaxID=1940611 RepID=A0ABU4HY27_9ACTN|nr:hypothetical protein [Conexibacter stalactiti]MDW5598233.1 hypothetical protein [Conexibacter stalactiti]MEC5038875.1 hypothetical protein [Conexibacter stalactiti]
MHGRVGAGRTLAAGLALLASAALLPATAAEAATKAKPALATGVSRDRAASFRLEGRQLTVRLRRPLLPAGRRSRGYVRFVCGEEAAQEAPTTIDDAILAARGGARPLLRKLAGRRTITLTLNADVAAQANWCGLRVGGVHARSLVAAMTLKRGTPVRCVAADRDDVLAENERVLVTQAQRSGAFYTYAVMRGCLKPDGRWQQLDRGSSDRLIGSRWPVSFTVAGTWVAWLRPPIDDSRCTLMRRDLAGGETAEVTPPPVGFSGSCQTAFRLAPDGAISDVTGHQPSG